MAQHVRHFNQERVPTHLIRQMEERQQQQQQQQQQNYDDKKLPVQRKAGDILIGNTGRNYTILQIICFGGYSGVYKVKQKGEHEALYALKEEMKKPNSEFKIQMEYEVLQAAKNGNDHQKKHFPTLHDFNFEDKSFKYIVMTLLGESLAEIKYRQPDRVFSLNTAFFCAIESMEAIKALHSLGFLHRDIKPANYCVGSKHGKENTRFVGTVRYAPITMHRGEEYGRKDDCESWIYMVGDMMNKAKLPWHFLTDVGEVGEMKENVFADPTRLFPGPELSRLRTVMDYISKKKSKDRLDYDYLGEMVRRLAKKKRCSLAAPFDWN